MAPRIHLVFKTHLDIGFTDHAAKVRAQYHDRFIPQAIETGEHFFYEDPTRPRFIWTTGAWLIWDHLQTQPRERVARLERAIERGLIRWHALPFTTHSELMSPAVFREALSISAELDQRFGLRTIAAKMTDVPGHTLGIVPLLAEAGVRFLHLGVNTASPPPDVPDLFRWRAPGGEEVVVMYQRSYGETEIPEGFEEGLAFAHTSDNVGPQSVPQVADAHRELRRHYPEATIRASTLEAFGEVVWNGRETLPVIDLELGDSWIHGSASDPAKTAGLLALQRLYDSFAEEHLSPSRKAFGRGLAMVAEHTCGVDIKSYLRDETAWDRPAFEAARRTDPRFAYTEASWAEQRAYLDSAVEGLGPSDRQRAEEVLAELEPGPALGSTSTAVASIEVGGWTVTVDPSTGDIAALRAPDGLTVNGESGSLMGYRYESYDVADLTAHMDSYLVHREPWAILDHAKPGLEHAATARSARFVPRLMGSRDGGLLLAMDDLAVAQLGAPRQIEVGFRPIDAHRIEVSFVLRDKPANRMPEASFVTLTPHERGPWDYLKMGLWQPGDRVARRGGGQLQAVTAVRRAGLEVRPLDTPLVAPAGSPFMPFESAPPDLSAGLRFNLHNNKWGTNFPMWWGGVIRARFLFTLS